MRQEQERMPRFDLGPPSGVLLSGAPSEDGDIVVDWTNFLFECLWRSYLARVALRPRAHWTATWMQLNRRAGITAVLCCVVCVDKMRRVYM